MKRHLALAARLAVVCVFLGLLILVGRGLLAGKRARLAGSPIFELAAAPVQTAVAYLGDLDDGHDYLAVIDPLQVAEISARITATIDRIHVQEGDSVAAGDLLVSLDDRQYRDALATMEAQIVQAEAERATNEATVSTLRETVAYWERQYERDRTLAEGGAVPRVQVETTAEKRNETRGQLAGAELRSTALEQQIQVLRRKTDELRTTLSYGAIVTPFAGVVTRKEVDTGDLAVPGKTLVVIEDRSSVKLAFEVPQSDLPAFRPGLPVSFTVNGVSRQSTVSRLYPSLSRARMVRAEAVLSGESAADLPLGAYVDAAVVFRRHEGATLVPVDALVESGTRRQVFVVRDGRLSVQAVEVLGMACETAAVTGLEPGEEVVVSSFLGWARLADGMKVSGRQVSFQ